MVDIKDVISYYEDNHTLIETANKFGYKSYDPIKLLFKKNNYVWRSHKQASQVKKLVKPNSWKGAVGSKNRNWRGGVKLEKGKYRLIWTPNHPNAVNNYVREHTLVMEKHIERYLTDDEVVHHIDENTFNNDISNLQLMTFNEHRSLHAKIAKRDNAGKFIK